MQQEVQVLATMPHMHEIGTGFELDLVRDGDTTNLLRLKDWDFETQLFYELQDFDFRFNDQVPKALVPDLASCAFIANRENILPTTDGCSASPRLISSSPLRGDEPMDSTR